MHRLIVCVALLSGCAPGNHYLKWDNDILGGRGTDNNYTNGVKIGKVTPDDTGSHDVYIQQLLYTPANKQLTTYQPTQRPYAALLVAGYSGSYIRSPNIQDSYGVQAGIVGPHAYGEQVQNTVHKWINNKTAKGWSNQLHDEPAIMGTAERTYYLPVTENVDVQSTTGVNIGTPFTQGYSGILTRYGFNLPAWIHSGGPIFPRLPSSKSPSFYVFGGGLGRAVVWNTFLDGNAFRDSAEINKETLVAEGRVGFAVEYAGYKLGFMRMYQTKEHAGETHGAAFGEVTLSYEW